MEINTDKVGHLLQDSLVELVDLSLTAKQAHWNVHGPGFKSLHEQLDELTVDVRAAMDEVAERAVAIGFAPDGRAATVAKASPLPDFPEGGVRDADAIGLIVERLKVVCERTRSRIDTLDELDLVSQDLLIGILATLDKHHWMFAARQR
jgi:starvation-inducible DNA-binding protein